MSGSSEGYAEHGEIPTLNERLKDTLELAMRHGHIEDDHGQWVIDQMVRKLTGCSEVGESDEYREFVRRYNDGEDGPNTNEWGKGTAP